MRTWNEYVEARRKLQDAAKIEGVFSEDRYGEDGAILVSRLTVDAPAEALPEIARWLAEVAADAGGYLTVSFFEGSATACIQVHVSASDIPPLERAA